MLEIERSTVITLCKNTRRICFSFCLHHAAVWYDNSFGAIQMQCICTRVAQSVANTRVFQSEVYAWECTLLPSANEVWGKVTFSQVSVCPQGVCGRCPQADIPWADTLGQTPPWADTPRQTPPPPPL